VSGWGLDHALPAWGAYFKNTYLPKLCEGLTLVDCLDTYNTTSPYWTDTKVDNAARSWFWIVCNEVGYFQEGAPRRRPSLVTRLVRVPYDLRQCQQMFPAAFPTPPEVRVKHTNKVYKGWNVRAKRLFFANGKRRCTTILLSQILISITAGDPWRDATMSAEWHFVPSSPWQPIGLSDGFHCSDLGTSSGLIDPTIAFVQDAALASMKHWLSTWRPSGQPHYRNETGSSEGGVIQHIFHQDDTKPINAFFKSSGVF